MTCLLRPQPARFADRFVRHEWIALIERLQRCRARTSLRRTNYNKEYNNNNNNSLNNPLQAAPFVRFCVSYALYKFCLSIFPHSIYLLSLSLSLSSTLSLSFPLPSPLLPHSFSSPSPRLILPQPPQTVSICNFWFVFNLQFLLDSFYISACRGCEGGKVVAGAALSRQAVIFAETEIRFLCK